MADVYSASESARVIGVSERRVRQLADSGVLEVVSVPGEALKISQESAHAERQKRKDQPPKPEKPARAKPSDSVTATEVFAMAEALAERIMVRALEAGEADRQATREMNARVEKALKDELDRTRAELEIANRELEEMKIRARWWRVPR